MHVDAVTIAYVSNPTTYGPHINRGVIYCHLGLSQMPFYGLQNFGCSQQWIIKALSQGQGVQGLMAYMQSMCVCVCVCFHHQYLSNEWISE